MGAIVKVELSDIQAEQLAFALYPTIMDYCKKIMEVSKKENGKDEI